MSLPSSPSFSTPPAAAPAIAAIDMLVLPSRLDGSGGANRGSARRAQIAAGNDVDAIKAWLARFADTPTTFQNYRKEAERLLLWTTLQLDKPLSSLTHEDWLRYQAFLADPQPAARWIAAGGRKHPRASPGWRPFAGPLAPASQRQAGLILNALFSWLVSAGYLAGNPLALSRGRRRAGPPRISRYLDDATWAEVKATIAALPRGTPRQREHYLRLRWVFTLLYLCGLRISEAAAATMGGFFLRRGADGAEQWWLEVLGKGGKLRIVPASAELMAELAAYRRALDLPATPSALETAPLIAPIGGKPRQLSRGGLHDIVKRVFVAAAERLRARDPEHAAAAERLLQASAHWLRHTAGSHMANGAVDLRHVRDNLGHSSIGTTNSYLHSADEARHSETQGRHKIGW